MTKIAGIGFNTGDVGGDLTKLEAKMARFTGLCCDMVEVTAIGLDAVSACRVIPERAKAVRDILDRHDMSRSMHAPILINLMDEAHLLLQERAAVASLELAAEIGATVVVLHPGRAHPDVFARESGRLLALERDALGRVADRAATLGVRIAYENISPNRRVIDGLETSYSLDPLQLAAQLAALDHPAVVACLDVSHAQQGAGLWDFDMVSASAALCRHIHHIHFSDSTGVPATPYWSTLGEAQFFGVGDMHAPPGWGAIDFDALAQALDVAEGTRIVIELKSNYHHHAAPDILAAARRFAHLLEHPAAKMIGCGREPARA